MDEIFRVPGIDIQNIGISPGEHPKSVETIVTQVAAVIGEIARGELEIVELGD